MIKQGPIFLNLCNLHPKKLAAVYSGERDADFFLKATASDLKKCAALSDEDVGKIDRVRASGQLEHELKLLGSYPIECIDLSDERYPVLLKEIPQPPLVLYCKGDVKALNGPLLAIVGSRIPTIYGISMAEYFSYRLTCAGFTVVSGLARGIDTAAHASAIIEGNTVAVLGSGLLRIYPKDNEALSERIASGHGALISEFPLTTPPLKENFPRRNRIISGLSRGVLVVEAALASGALITARFACEQNREVFALPGNADSPVSKGNHMLIKQGAKLVDSLDDILEEVGMHISADLHADDQTPALEPLEQKVYDSFLKQRSLSLEELIRDCGLDFAQINKTVLEMQLKGLLREVRPSVFVKAR